MDTSNFFYPRTNQILVGQLDLRFKKGSCLVGHTAHEETAENFKEANPGT